MQRLWPKEPFVTVVCWGSYSHIQGPEYESLELAKSAANIIQHNNKQVYMNNRRKGAKPRVVVLQAVYEVMT